MGLLDISEYQWGMNTLKTLDFFSHCTDDDLMNLVESLEKHSYKSGATILFQGEISNRLYIIKQGSVGIWKSIAGEKKMVAELGENRYFGEISLLTPTSATATVKAHADVDIFSLAYENLEYVFRKNVEQIKIIEQKILDKKKN